jgi:hypothetical protein
MITYEDIRRTGFDRAELNQRNREEDYLREMGLIGVTTYRKGRELSVEAKSAVKSLMKQIGW